MDIALRTFLDHRATRRKLIVFSAAEKYLYSGSLLEKTLASILGGTKQASASILLTSNNPTGISDSILTQVDFILSSPFPWLYGFCRYYWPSTAQAFRSVRRDQVMIISPGSLVMESSDGVPVKWDQVPLIVDLGIMAKGMEESKRDIAPSKGEKDSDQPKGEKNSDHSKEGNDSAPSKGGHDDAPTKEPGDPDTWEQVGRGWKRR
ncbi:hypothetical protein CPB86DRAFT_791460 [Serendipita vermifera]|nr:hypothetical protein CPB86DRAFT_791460 [Serendipita vermifera]